MPRNGPLSFILESFNRMVFNSENSLLNGMCIWTRRQLNEKIIYDLKVIKIYAFENNFHSKQTVL